MLLDLCKVDDSQPYAVGAISHHTCVSLSITEQIGEQHSSHRADKRRCETRILCNGKGVTRLDVGMAYQFQLRTGS